jgi:hypothetical protein
MLPTYLAFSPRAVSALAAFAATTALWLVPRVAVAQPLRPLPPPEPSAPSALPAPAPAPPPAPPYAPDAPASSAPPPPVYYAPAPAPAPPPIVYVEPPPTKHAPKYSLYVGGRLGIIGFGGNFFDNQQGHSETTGNFAKSGGSLEANIGARLGKRYIPYVALELSVLAPGHRFDGADTKASSSFLGIGFRYVAGDVDTAGFLTDLSFGIRTVSVTSAGQTYKMSSVELFRLGLGAEIRLSNLMTLTPMFLVSGGAMTDTQGNVPYGPLGHDDGVLGPRYANGHNIDQQRGYLVVGLGCGLYFDFFGK